MRLLVIVRHAHSMLNLERRVNGDPGIPVDLTEQGASEARLLGLQLANLPLDLCVHTRFGRTRQTAQFALEGRDVPLRTEPLFDDIDVGELEGVTIAEYRDWKRGRLRRDPFPGGESLDDAARRYAQGYRTLLAEPRGAILLVCHEIPLRYALNGALASDDLDAPVHDVENATPFFFDEGPLLRATERIEELAGRGPTGTPGAA